jgi:hypothetical protein
MREDLLVVVFTDEALGFALGQDDVATFLALVVVVIIFVTICCRNRPDGWSRLMTNFCQLHVVLGVSVRMDQFANVILQGSSILRCAFGHFVSRPYSICLVQQVVQDFERKYCQCSLPPIRLRLDRTTRGNTTKPNFLQAM